MRVLIIDGVGPFGGASRSLFESMRAMKGDVERLFLVQTGTANAFYRNHAKDMIAVKGLIRFDNTRASHYQGVRWLILLRELAYVPFTLFGLWSAKRKWASVDLIHVNEVTEIIPGLLAKWLFKAPMIVHVRSLMWRDRGKWRNRWLRRMLRNHADAIVAIDENVRDTIGADLPAHVIHNSFDHENMPKVEGQSSGAAGLNLPENAFVVGFVGNLHLGKGIFELLEAARILKARGAEVHYLIVGSSPRSDSGLIWTLLNIAGIAQEQQSAFLARLKGTQLEDCFHFVGHTADIGQYLTRMNVLTFPSHFDACGRPVFEAAFYSCPSIVALSDPKPDTLDHGVTGLAIPAPDPSLLADAIAEMMADPERTRAMGQAARALAVRNFTPTTNAAELYALYQDVLARHGRLVTPEPL